MPPCDKLWRRRWQHEVPTAAVPREMLSRPQGRLIRHGSAPLLSASSCGCSVCRTPVASPRMYILGERSPCVIMRALPLCHNVSSPCVVMTLVHSAFLTRCPVHRQLPRSLVWPFNRAFDSAIEWARNEHEAVSVCRWAMMLPACIQVCPIELPGRGRRREETSISDVAELADMLADSLPLQVLPPIAAVTPTVSQHFVGVGQSHTYHLITVAATPEFVRLLTNHGKTQPSFVHQAKRGVRSPQPINCVFVIDGQPQRIWLSHILMVESGTRAINVSMLTMSIWYRLFEGVWCRTSPGPSSGRAWVPSWHTKSRSGWQSESTRRCQLPFSPPQCRLLASMLQQS